MKIQCKVCDETKGILKQVRRFGTTGEIVLCTRCHRKITPNTSVTMAVWQGKSWGAELVIIA